MNCKQCGALLHEYSRFCPECGSPVIMDVPDIQGTCEQENVNQPEMPEQENVVQPEIFVDGQNYSNDYSQPYDQQLFSDTTYNNIENTEKKNLKPLLILLIPLLVIIIVIVIVLCLIFGGGNGSDTPEEAVEQYIYSYIHSDCEELLEMVPEDYLEGIMDEYRMDEDEIIACLNEYLEEKYMYDRNDDKFYLSDIGDVDVRIKKVKKKSKSDLLAFKRTIKSSNNTFQIDKITGFTEVRTVNKFYGEDRDLLLKEENMYTAIEYDDEWYAYAACNIIYLAVENY